MKKEEYEACRLRLGRYRDLLRRLERRTEEANRWAALSQRSTAVPDRMATGHPPRDIGQVKATEIAIREECDELALQAHRERELLCAAIAAVQSTRSRELLESVYLNGRTLEQIANSTGRTEKTVRRQLFFAIAHLAAASDFFD